MKWRFIPSEHHPTLLKNIVGDANVVVPALVEDHWHWRMGTKDSPAGPPEGGSASTRAPYRVVESLKTFFFTPTEYVGGDVPSAQDTVVLGVKNCDLLALRILDQVFLEGAFEEPFYKGRREKTVIIADDCSDCLPSCFCVGIGHKPYPEGIADLILSPVEGGDLVGAGTERGEELLKKHAGEFAEATESQLADQAQRRAAMEEKVRASLREQELEVPENPVEALQAKWSDKVWDKLAETCVECGACNFVCPSCHCFFLTDTKVAGGATDRSRVWDACLSENFSRVAGGANPNKRRQVRLRHRVERKFIAPYEAKEGYACTGCGRCIDACIGHIDIRKILREVADA